MALWLKIIAFIPLPLLPIFNAYVGIMRKAVSYVWKDKHISWWEVRELILIAVNPKTFLEAIKDSGVNIWELISKLVKL